MNANGLAATAASSPLPQGEQLFYDTAYASVLNPDGTVTTSRLIMSSPNGEYAGGAITIVGINTANQVLLGTSFPDRAYDALVYNINTQTLTDLDYLPAITSGDYSNLQPIAIDNQGQILVTTSVYTPEGTALDTLLLTPGGAPEPLAAPEPGSCVLWFVATCASYVGVKRAKFIRRAGRG